MTNLWFVIVLLVHSVLFIPCAILAVSTCSHYASVSSLVPYIAFYGARKCKWHLLRLAIMRSLQRTRTNNVTRSVTMTTARDPLTTMVASRVSPSGSLQWCYTSTRIVLCDELPKGRLFSLILFVCANCALSMEIKFSWFRSYSYKPIGATLNVKWSTPELNASRYVSALQTVANISLARVYRDWQPTLFRRPFFHLEKEKLAFSASSPASRNAQQTQFRFVLSNAKNSTPAYYVTRIPDNVTEYQYP